MAQAFLSNRYFRGLSDDALADCLTYGVSKLEGVNIGRAWREHKRRLALKRV